MSGFSTEEPLPPSTPVRLPVETEAKAPVFQSQEANQAAADYAEAFTEIKNFQSAVPADPVANPGSVTAGLSEIGARMDRLSAAKQRIESSLAPNERARWKTLRKNIETPESE